MGVSGRRGHKKHKIKARTRRLWCLRPGFGWYGRGNFPGHHVLGCLPKSGVHGCIYIFMHMHGCNGAHGHGGEKKQDKKSPKWARMAFLWCMVVVQKQRKVAGTIMVARDDHFEEWGGKKDGCGVQWMCIRKGNAKKTTSGAKKNENEWSQIDVHEWFSSKCKEARNEPNKASKIQQKGKTNWSKQSLYEGKCVT